MGYTPKDTGRNVRDINADNIARVKNLREKIQEAIRDHYDPVEKNKILFTTEDITNELIEAMFEIEKYCALDAKRGPYKKDTKN